ncbi:MAG: hypothetical protein Q7J68_07460 [Thermoplasmata archaeon]|nr:hypothetical protein [Thermoplasmata archaeon]
MVSIVGIDSRIFIRDTIKKNGMPGHFESVVGIAVKVRDYLEFNQKYIQVMSDAFKSVSLTTDYQSYCVNDLKDLPEKDDILAYFVEHISRHIEKVHVFYTLFSKDRLKEVKVYGRMAQKKKIKLAAPTRTYEELINEHLIHCFPAICAWRLTEYLSPGTIEFHLDSYGGNICEAQEELDDSDFTIFVYPSGDCCNPVISTADLLLDVMDTRLEKRRKLLIFDNIRPAISEFGDNLLVYPILNKHLPSITPLEQKPIDTISKLKHPVFWVFKGDSLINSGIMKRSKTYRNLVDYAATQFSVVKMFDRSKDIDYVQMDDFGVYLNTQGKEIIESYRKLGKPFKPFDLDVMVPKENK